MGSSRLGSLANHLARLLPGPKRTSPSALAPPLALSPQGQGESLSAHVARILDVIDKSGVPYQLTPMGTILEGEWEDVMGVVTACFNALQADCPRIGMNLKVDYRAGPDWRLRSKVEKLEQQLGRTLSK